MNAPTFTITRVFDAQRGLVWKAWTDPKLFSKWFGPKGFTGQTKTMDLRPGGILHSCLKSPDGNEMWAKFLYRQVDAPSRLAWEHSFSDKDGNITRHPLQASWPLKLLTTVVFEDRGGQTKITLTWTPLDATEAECKTFEDGMSSMKQGWGGTFDQLAEFLNSRAAA
jgi:uncharacterized protein YndB with AHSA1/START domain